MSNSRHRMMAGRWESAASNSRLVMAGTSNSQLMRSGPRESAAILNPQAMRARRRVPAILRNPQPLPGQTRARIRHAFVEGLRGESSILNPQPIGHLSGILNRQMAGANTTNLQLLRQNDARIRQAVRLGLESSRRASSILNPQMPAADTASPHFLSQNDAHIRQILRASVERMFFDSQTFNQLMCMIFGPRPQSVPTAGTNNSQSSTSTHSLSEGLIPTARGRQLVEPTFGFEGLFLDSQIYDVSLSLIFNPLPPPIPMASTSNSQSSSTHSLFEGRQLHEPTFRFEGLFLDSQTFDESLSTVFGPQPPPIRTSSTVNSQSSTSTHSLPEGLIPIVRGRQLHESTFGFEGLLLDSQTYDESLSTVFGPQPPPTPTASTTNSQSSTSLIPTARRRQLHEPTFGFEGLFMDSQTYDESLSMVFGPQPPLTPIANTTNSQSSTSAHSLSEGLMPTARGRQLHEPTFGFESLLLDSQTYDESLSTVFGPQPPPTPTASTTNSQSSTSLIPTSRGWQLHEPTFGFESLFFDSQTYDESQSPVFGPQPPPTPTASTTNSQSSTSTHSLSEGLIPTARGRQLHEPMFGFEGLLLDSQTYDESLSTVFGPQPPPTPTASTTNSQSSTSLIPTSRGWQLHEPTFGFESLFFDSRTYDESLSTIFGPQPPLTLTANTTHSQLTTSTHSLSEGLIPTTPGRQLHEPMFGFEGLLLDSQTYDESLSTVFGPQPSPTPMASTTNSQSSTSLIPTARRWQLHEPMFGFEGLFDPDYQRPTIT